MKRHDERATRSAEPRRRSEHERVLREVLFEAMLESPVPPRRLPESLLHAVRERDSQGQLVAGLTLIRAQWPIVARERLILGLLGFIALVFGAAAGIGRVGEYDLLTLTAALPIAAGLFILLLSGPSADPAHVVISTTRTPFGAIVFARTTVAVTLLVLFSFAASVVLAGLGEHSIPVLVAAWLGPTVVLAALATLLAQVWRPVLTVSATLAGWGLVVAVIALEMSGVLAPWISMMPILRPGFALVTTQAGMAVALLATAWWLGARLMPRGARA